MEWTDTAIILTNRPHGETHSVAHLFTHEHGHATGLVYGGQGRSKGALLQAGNGVQARWRARTDDSLGAFELELDVPRAASAMSDRQSLAALSCITDLLYDCLPERMAYPGLYLASCALLDHIEDFHMWSVLLVKWELGLLQTLGFGLTLDRCVATGRLLQDGAELVFVSPKSGGAVSYNAGMPYKDRMLPLPPFMTGMGEPTIGDVKAALGVTGFFLAERLLSPAGKTLPEGRERLIARLQ